MVGVELVADLGEGALEGEAGALVEFDGGVVGQSDDADEGVEAGVAAGGEEGLVEERADAGALGGLGDVDSGFGGGGVCRAFAPAVGLGVSGEGWGVWGWGGELGDEEGVEGAVGKFGVVVGGAVVLGGGGIGAEVDGGVEDVVVGEVGDGLEVVIGDGADADGGGWGGRGHGLEVIGNGWVGWDWGW